MLSPNEIQCDCCDNATSNAEDDYGEIICDDCLQNREERAWERYCTSDHTSLEEQMANARRLK